MIPRLILATFVPFLVFVSAPCAAAHAMLSPCAAPVTTLVPILDAPVGAAHYNQVAKTSSTEESDIEWMRILIRSNPTALVAWDGDKIVVTSATNTQLVMPTNMTTIPPAVSVFNT